MARRRRRRKSAELGELEPINKMARMSNAQEVSADVAMAYDMARSGDTKNNFLVL